jgi:hypothetical protein
MNRPTLFILIALNVLFVTVLAGEWFAETETLATQKVEPKNDEVEIEALPTLDALTETSEDDYSDLVERPMFIKGRKPVNEPEPENTPVAVTQKMDVFVWDLTGIFTSPKGTTAFLNRTNAKVEKDNYRKIKVGDVLDGWKMMEVQLDKVILTQANETKILLLRKSKSKISMPTQTTNHSVPPKQAAVPAQVPVLEGTPVQTLQVPAATQNPDDLSEENVNPENQ